MKKLLSLMLVSLILFTGCGKNNTDSDKPAEPNKPEQPNVVTEPGVIEDKTLGEFSFSNTSMMYENGDTQFEVTVTNTSAQTAYLNEFIIHVMDADNNEIATLKGFVGDNIGAGESKVISSGISADLTSAKNITYEVSR